MRERPRRGAALIGMQTLLAVLCGGAVGFSLGLIGGGGSILAVPLLLYVVGVDEPHVAIGTSALRGLRQRIRQSHRALARGNGEMALRGGVRGRRASIGAADRLDARQAGRRTEAALPFRARDDRSRLCDAAPAPRGRRRKGPARSFGSRSGSLFSALLPDSLSGFFGIGGGFLIVPGHHVRQRACRSSTPSAPRCFRSARSA